MKLKDIAKATNGKLIGRDLDVSGISIDSRTAKRGNLFIAIKGKRYDGHSFIEEAIKKGIAAVILERKGVKSSLKVPSVIVSDPLKALGDVAQYHRRKFNIPVIGITGSNGKTTVKELVAYILSAKYNTLKNSGTENNLIGLPLTLLKLKKKHEVAVLEMGANHVGEIKRLSYILGPTIGLITNIGPSHLEYFKDLKTVLKAKSEILSNISRHGSIVLNRDDKFLEQLPRKFNTITFGIRKKSDFQATNITQIDQKLQFDLNGKIRFKLNLAGRHNIYNALASIAVAQHLKVKIETIRKTLAEFKPLPMRMNLDRIKGINIIDDTYNSNPLSTECAIQFLSNFKTRGKKILVAGDMLELGNRAKYFHRRIGKLTADSLINNLITVGELSSETHSSARKFGMRKESIWRCASPDKAAHILNKITRPGDVVLVKGSRAMGMEKIIKKLKRK